MLKLNDYLHTAEDDQILVDNYDIWTRVHYDFFVSMQSNTRCPSLAPNF